MKTRAKPRLTLAVLALFSVLTACDESGGNVRNTDAFAEETFSLEVTLAQEEFFDLEGINGQIEVVGDPGRTSIVIEGIRRVESESVADAQAYLERLSVVLTERPGFVRVHTDQPSQPKGRNFIVDYVVTVPIELQVDVANINGSITLEALGGDVDVQNVNGLVRLLDLRGNTVAGIINGELEASLVIPENGLAQLSTVNGNIALALPQTTSATLSASVTNGGVRVSGFTVSDVNQTPRSFDGVLGGGAGTIEVTTVNGTIEVRGS